MSDDQMEMQFSAPEGYKLVREDPPAPPEESHGSPTVADTPEDDVPEEPTVLVKGPKGWERIPQSDFDAAIDAQNERMNRVSAPAKPRPESEVYVHLANGEVKKVKESQVPSPAGSNAMNGYFVENGKAHHVIGVYPVETDHVASEDE